MPSLAVDRLGRPAKEIDVTKVFFAEEGRLEQLSGKIGQGKTYMATQMAIEFAEQGYNVITNWEIFWDGKDQRDSVFHIIRSLIFPGAKTFYAFDKSNIEYIDLNQFESADEFTAWLDSKNNVIMLFDEGHIFFDSYELMRMSMKKRQAILHTRHFRRTMIIVSQRPSAIHATVRGNVSRFHKVEKIALPFITLFKVTTTEELNSSEMPDFDDYESIKLKIASKRIFQAYDSWYIGKGATPSQELKIDAYELTYLERLQSLFNQIQALIRRIPRLPLMRGRVAPEEPVYISPFESTKKFDWREIKQEN